MLGTLVDGRYKLAELLGSGRLFDTYRAVGQGGVVVVVKVLREPWSEDRDLLIRLRARLRKITGKSAREIVPLLGADAVLADAATPRYLVREHRPETSSAVAAALSPDDLHALALDLATAIRTLHSWGLVHGGIHPGNLFVASAGTKQRIVRLADAAIGELAMGLASDEDERRLYSLPDLRSGRPAQPVDDVYSWGALMFALMTGSPPTGPCDREHLAILEGRFQGFGIDVVRRAFHEEPSRRFKDAAALVVAVASDFRVIPVRPDEPGVRPRAPRPAPPPASPPSSGSSSAPATAAAARPAAPAASPAARGGAAASRPPAAPAAAPSKAAVRAADAKAGADATKLKGDLARRIALLGSQTHYELLGVQDDAPGQEIHEAFRALAKRFHPDRVSATLGSAERPRAERFFESLTEAHELLSNDRQRISYDLDLRTRATRALQGADASSAGPRDRKAVTQEYLRDAAALASRSDHFGASQAIRQALHLEPDSAELQLELGRQLAKMPNHHRAAEQALLRVLELKPRTAEVHYLLGTMYREHGMESRADEQIRKAREIDPKDPRWREGRTR